MKKLGVLFAFGLMINSVVVNSQNKDIYYKDIAFKKADVSVNMSCAVYFRDVSITIPFGDLVIDIDKIDVRLESGSRNNYTTLDILNMHANAYITDPYLHADKVTVVVRNKEDYKSWTDFLKKAKKARDTYVRKSLQPVRVLPPQL